MPNGVDKNLYRLKAACAVYRGKYGEWPSQARFAPGILQDLAGILDIENFERLAAHLELRTADHNDITVGGRGVVKYSDNDEPDPALLSLTERWLGLQVRRDVEH